MEKEPSSFASFKHLVKTRLIGNQDFQKKQFDQLNSLLQDLKDEVDKSNMALGILPAQQDSHITGRLDNLDNALLNIGTIVTSLTDELSTGKTDLGILTSQLNTVTGRLDNLDNALLNISSLVTQANTAENGTVTRTDFANLAGQLDTVTGRLSNLDNALANISTMVVALYEHPTTLESATREATLQSLAITAMARRQDLTLDKIAKQADRTQYSKAASGDYQTRLKNLEKLIPQTFPKWQKLFENGKAAYQANPEGSLAQWGDSHAEGFRNFCSINMLGRVLDIGCGPRGKPFYLQGYPSEFISAVEPLELENEVDFELVRGFNEDLPWPDKSFNAVINSTSLDHVLDLDKSLEETHRVLAEDGKFIVWIGSIPGGKVYDPHNPDLQPIDEFHLFHIEQSWFEPYLDKWFQIEEKIEFPNASFTHIFYVFSKREL